MRTIPLTENVNLHIHPTAKFKDVTIRMELLMPFRREELAGSLLLSFLLSDVCSRYPAKADSQRISDELYGGVFTARSTTRGTASIFEFTCTVVDGRFVKEEHLLEKQLAWMAEYIMRPLIINGRFEEHLYTECIQKLRDLVDLSLDRPADAAVEAAAVACGGLYGLKGLPSLQEISALKNEETAALYQRMLAESAIDLIAIGNIDEQICEREVRRLFQFAPRRAGRSFLYVSHQEKSLQLEQKRRIGQSSLVLIYETGRAYTYPLSTAFMLGNGMLGGLPTSLLFQEVREKNGLCYDISSENEVYDGILLIEAEVECGSEDRAEALIRRQVERIREGDFSDELLESTRIMYASSWMSSQDSVRSLIWDDYRSLLIGKNDSVEARVAQFNRVTRQEVIEAWKNVAFRVRYRIVPQEDTDESNH